MKRELAALWKEDGSVEERAPRWARVRSDMRTAFPTYYSTGDKDPFAELVGQAIRELDRLKPAPDGPAFLGNDPSGPHYGDVTRAELAEGRAPVTEVLHKATKLFQGMPNWNHPLTMPNVIPPPNMAAIIAAMMTDVFSPNMIEGEYAWNVEVAEMETAAMLARLIGWDPEAAGGISTFGGSGCYFYGMKYALTQVLGTGSRCTGIRTDGKLLVSQQGHYTMKNATDWTGLGMDNIIEIETDEATNAMSLQHLEEVMKELRAQGTPVVSVVCTMGTTDAFAMDPVAGVRELIDRHPNPEGFGKPFLYCDAVIGWAWLTYGTYDFERNPMGFSDEVLPLIRKNLEKIREVVHADAVGCDFHKVGWAPYNSSIVMLRDYNHFRRLMTRPGSDYLQERTCYNPGLYTLEASRSGSYAMAAWATLKFFGHEGFQAILGGILEMEHYLRGLLAENLSLVCVNADDHGFVTLFRVYPEGVDAEEQYHRELTDPAYKQDLIRNNDLQERVANRLWSWFRDGQRHHGAYAPYTSYSTGFRPTTYNRDESDPKAIVYALKSFPMNLNIDPSSMRTLVDLVLAARDEVVGEKGTTPEPSGNCPLPYKQRINGIDCQAELSGRRRAAEDLLGGVVRRRS